MSSKVRWYEGSLAGRGPLGDMREDDSRYMRQGQWTRRNGQLAEGTIIGREGKRLIIDAVDVRAVPFLVNETKVTLLGENGQPIAEDKTTEA